MVAGLDADGTGVVMGTLVEELHAVSLGRERRREVDGYHLQHGVASRQPLPAHTQISHHGTAAEIRNTLSRSYHLLLLSSISLLPLVFHLPSTSCLPSPLYLLSSISIPLVFHLPTTSCLPSSLYLLSSISLLPLVFGFLLLSLPPPISLLLIQCKEHYLPHDGLEKGFPLLLAVLRVEFDLQFLNHLGRLVFLEVHDGIKHLERGRIGREGGGGRGEKERFAKALILYYGGFPLIRRH